MRKFFAFVYGLAAYFTFLGTILYAIAFVTDLVVPKTIDRGGVIDPVAKAVAVNLLLMAVFALQHSVMARKGFKAFFARLVPKAIERSTYVLVASLLLILLFWQWEPIPTLIWRIDNPAIAAAVQGLSLAGWVIVFASTFLINHFELFGLHQVMNNLAGRAMPEPKFHTPLFYRIVRHPLYLGFIIAFWAAPTMTAGHLLFAAVTTAYIFVGIVLEERDLIDLFGEEYRRYRTRVPMVLPWLR